MLLKSLAGTSAMYVPAQIAVRENHLHIQIAGPEGNRPYGFATDADAEPAILAWARGGDLPSLAGTGNDDYRAVQMRVRDGMVHVQGKGVDVNRHYGIAFDISGDEELWSYVAEMESLLETNPIGYAALTP